MDTKRLGDLLQTLGTEDCPCPEHAGCRAEKEDLRREVARLDLGWWRLAFADRGKNTAMVVRAFGPLDAAREARWRGMDAPVVSSVRMAEYPAPAKEIVGVLLTDGDPRLTRTSRIEG